MCLANEDMPFGRNILSAIVPPKPFFSRCAVMEMTWEMIYETDNNSVSVTSHNMNIYILFNLVISVSGWFVLLQWKWEEVQNFL